MKPTSGRLARMLAYTAMLGPWTSGAYAATIVVPNASFESPIVPTNPPCASEAVGYWQKTPQPAWYEPSQNYEVPWTMFMGCFYNMPAVTSFIDNCDGLQAAFVFSKPGAGLFQDYNSISDTNTTPDHAFNSKYTVGMAYILTVGVLGGGDGLLPGDTFEISLYYRDASTNLETVAAVSITNSPSAFPTNTHFVDYRVETPPVRSTDPWAGKNIGIRLLSTSPDPLLGSYGYWDLDNVRLTERSRPLFIDVSKSADQLQLTLVSEQNARLEIQATANPGPNPSNWVTLGDLTNFTGTARFYDTTTNQSRRFYRAQQF